MEAGMVDKIRCHLSWVLGHLNINHAYKIIWWIVIALNDNFPFTLSHFKPIYISVSSQKENDAYEETPVYEIFTQNSR